MIRLRFRRFQSQLLLFFLGLFTVIQLIGFVVTRELNERDAYARVAESLAIAGGALAQQLIDRDARLLQSGRLLAGDFAFKSAWSTRDAPTILSMLDNHRNRIGADWMALVDLDDLVVADTLLTASSGERFDHPELIDNAYDSDEGEASGILFVEGRVLQVIILPLLSPLHEAWILIGFELDDHFVAQLQSFVRADISLVRMDQQPPTIHASTLTQDKQLALQESLERQALSTTEPQRIPLREYQYLSLALMLNAENEIPLFALMQRDMDEMLAPYRHLQNLLGLLFVAGVLATAVGTAMLAQGVAGPLRKLALSTERIAAGDYQQHIEPDRVDELGQLTSAFNQMAKGLAERDKVRDLLGKVVSPEIAEELLSRDVTLGGEDREVSVLFVDCHGFTSFSEGRAPREVLEQLNLTLTRLTDIIEAESGVVDKYIGDAIMALFGAPIEQPDAASRAVRAALAMVQTMQSDEEMLQVGIGINSGLVVAGNMGSSSRLNYSVIGDNVNLASRLESLTRYYGVPILISDSTRESAPDVICREIDRVQVKGRQQPVTLYEPLSGTHDEELLVMHRQALELYRRQSFTEAEALFLRLSERWPGKVYTLYQQRCQQFLSQSPGVDWDGVQRFDSKRGGVM
ncbi:adenylate/guanylate cyclase domain-containing protein [Nitrincola sp. MINF-07-Sa-05]|uniref:adenylate/guanylate cyclase domain-containing protein n=1 Tax=Nitrincola salilacus TaxID=3400273 RepID=UPI0039181ADC